MNFGIALLPGVKSGEVSAFAGGDIVTIPKGIKRVKDAVDFMRYILSDEVQVEGYAKALNLTTRADMANNKYFEGNPRVQEVAKALAVGQDALHLEILRTDQLAAGAVAADAAARLLHRRDLDKIIADAKAQMKAIAAECTRCGRRALDQLERRRHRLTGAAASRFAPGEEAHGFAQERSRRIHSYMAPAGSPSCSSSPPIRFFS